MPMRSGIVSAFRNNRAPHAGQKPRLTICPLSPFISRYFTSPVIVPALYGTKTRGTNVPPVARWQSRQWQFPAKTGSADHSIANGAACTATSKVYSHEKDPPSTISCVKFIPRGVAAETLAMGFPKGRGAALPFGRPTGFIPRGSEIELISKYLRGQRIVSGVRRIRVLTNSQIILDYLV